MPPAEITVSIVSHRQNALVNALLGDLNRSCATRVSVLVTENVVDSVRLSVEGLDCPVRVITNQERKGFGANHNAAFLLCDTPLYCVVNPDVRVIDDPFTLLRQALRKPGAAVVGPMVRSPEGSAEDSARRSPTVASLLRKLFVRSQAPEYPTDRGTVEVDWIAGMFMLFRSDVYRAVGGFDERYFLYYEDADICRRIRKAGLAVRYEPAVAIVHDARRASHRNPRLAAHHVASILRYLAH
jgi:GT2 family glycosyltransferase